MRIAVVSSYAYIVSNVNYGALLQYFALQEYLKKRGHKPFWVRYVLKDSLKARIRRCVKGMFPSEQRKRSHACLHSFQEFLEKYLSVSEELYKGESSINAFPPAADYYVTGSDQVWAGSLPANFLTFVTDPKKKIAYAVSFGKDTLENEHALTIRPWVNLFEHISVREKSGVEICRKLGKDNVSHVLDPTLLLDKEEYPVSLANRSAYVFCYFINLQLANSSIPWNKIQDYAKYRNRDLLISTASGSERYVPGDLIFPSPTEWLGLYKDADCIFTNTFHGVIFSIIFERPFLYIPQNGASSRQNCRIFSLLSLFDLEDRVLSERDNLVEKMASKIDWVLIKKKTEALRKETGLFFKACGL